MRSSTKMALAAWIIFGWPITVIVNFWTATLWSPFKIPPDADPSYWFAWSVAFFLIYLLPAFLLARAAAHVWRKLQRREPRSGA